MSAFVCSALLRTAYYSRPPVVVVQAPASAAYEASYAAPSHLSAPSAGADSSNKRSIFRSASGRNLAHRASNLPSYEERVRLFHLGYGSDPDVVFELWENLDSSSWWGLAGPCCPMGTPPSLLVPPNGLIPIELTDVYSIEQWADLRKRLEAVQRRHQVHPCPLFCLYLCCLPSCLDMAAEKQLRAIFEQENARLQPEGLYWDWREDAERPESRLRTAHAGETIQARRICALKADPATRQSYEKQHPNSRRIYRMDYGALVYPQSSGGGSPRPSASLSAPGAVQLHAGPSVALAAAPAPAAPTHSHVRSAPSSPLLG